MACNELRQQSELRIQDSVRHRVRDSETMITRLLQPF